MKYQSIVYTETGSFAVIELNRPAVRNSFDEHMARECLDALDAVRNSSSLRALLLTGSDKSFSAGQDLAEITRSNKPMVDVILRERFNKIVAAIRSLEVPVVCAVNGVAAGAGANIALCCDIVVAADTASFIQSFVQVGLIPDSAGTFFLPRLIGFARTNALAMLGEKLSADQALGWGLIYKVFPADTLRSEAEKITRHLAAQPTHAFAALKFALNESWSNALADQLELERKLQVELEKTADYQEGVRAFLEKRPPQFRGA